jgi:TnpA family transposase
MVRDDEDGRHRDQLFWVEENYLRAETLRAANAAPVDYHTKSELSVHIAGPLAR